MVVLPTADSLAIGYSISKGQGLRKKLIGICRAAIKPLKKDPTAFLDQGTSFTFDNRYYEQIVGHKGLASFNAAAGIFAGSKNDENGFLKKFGKEMVKMGAIEVLVRNNGGQTRKITSSFN